MYQIKCDGYVLYDPRDDELIVNNPKCNLETNTIGEASFSVYATHPLYGQMEKLRSVFEILQDGETIFRGRMTEDSKDFNNIKVIDLEGAMGYFNDSLFRPFSFPEDWLDDEEYQKAAETGNVIDFFLGFVIGYHNSQVMEFQQFKKGIVTVTDPNNYLFRESKEYSSAWEVLKTKLFDSSLGGYLCIRYEEDGNYIDYLADFDKVNTQKIKFGENLLDISTESDASEFYTAVVPLGAKLSEFDENANDSEEKLTIDDAEPLGKVDEDIYHVGDKLINRTLADKFGVIFAPVAETTWDDVTDRNNLLQKGLEYLKNIGSKLANTITVKAVDLHFSDDDIEAFRIYKYVDVESKPHGHEEQYRLTKLEIDIQNPQNTVITLGNTQLSMTDVNASAKKESKESVERIEATINNANVKTLAKDVATLKSDLQEIEDTLTNIMDNEWIALTLADSFMAYGGLDENKPMYKLSGNTVEIKGCVNPLEEFASSTEKIVFASGLPDELCPSSIRSFICQGDGMNRWLLTVEPEGTLTISRYGVSECVAVPTTEGLSFSVAYMV